MRWIKTHTHTHHCTILLGEACAWGGLPSFSVPVRGGTMHSDYCAETLLAYSWGRRGGLNGEWHSCTALLFQLTHLLASVVGGSLRVKLHYLVGEVHNDLIAGVLGRFFNGETALPCWWMKTYLLGCSLGSGIKLFTSISRRSTYWVVVFGVAMLFFRAVLESKNCTTSLDEWWRQFEWRNYTTFLSEITRRLTWHLALSLSLDGCFGWRLDESRNCTTLLKNFTKTCSFGWVATRRNLHNFADEASSRNLPAGLLSVVVGKKNILHYLFASTTAGSLTEPPYLVGEVCGDL